MGPILKRNLAQLVAISKAPSMVMCMVPKIGPAGYYGPVVALLPFGTNFA